MSFISRYFTKKASKNLTSSLSLSVGDDDAFYRALKPYTFAHHTKLRNLRSIGRTLVANGIHGDFCECGTYKGGSAAVLSTELESKAHLWLYDSFEGMPEISDEDGEAAAYYVGKGIASQQDVLNALKIAEFDVSCCTIRKGWFEDTFKEPLPKSLSLLHCDADWYDSVLLVLETFYPLIVDGGCVVLDDFGHWEGCREAFYEFCSRHNERPLLERFGVDQAYWFKGRQHNRS